MNSPFTPRTAVDRRRPLRPDRGWTSPPAAPAGPAPGGGATADAAASTAPPAWRVLVVDDNEDAAAMLAMLLQMSGHTTRIAHDGPQALAAADDFGPDAVLLDIGLPGIDGHEVARRLRRRPGGRELLLLAVTGWGQLPDRQATTDAGFDAHLVKPVDPDVLLQTLGQRLLRRTSPGTESLAPGGGDGG